jgi:hypothetical protein
MLLLFALHRIRTEAGSPHIIYVKFTYQIDTGPHAITTIFENNGRT